MNITGCISPFYCWHVTCFQFLAIMSRAAMSILMQDFWWTHILIFVRFIPRSWIPGSEGNMEMPRFSVWQFPKVVVINYILTTNESEFQLLHSPVNIWYWKSFFFLVLVGVQGYQIIVLIHISLMTNVVEHFSSVHCPLCIIFLWNA